MAFLLRIYDPRYPPEPDGTDIAVTLTKMAATSVASFGVPFAQGAVTDISQIGVLVNGISIPCNIEARLKWWDEVGGETGLRSVLIQFDAATYFPGAVGTTLDVTVRIAAVDSYSPGSTISAFADVSYESDQTSQICEWDIQGEPGTYALVAINERAFTHFPARLPAVIAHFPNSYVTGTRILGPLLSKAQVDADAALAGLTVLSDYIKVISEFSVHDTGYVNNSDPENGILDYTNYLNTDYNGYWYDRWLYDRTCTLLLASIYENDDDLLKHAYRHGYFYARTIYLSGTAFGSPLRGHSSVKLRTRYAYPDEEPTIPDEKYSKARGLLAYYALTGDESAATAVAAIADMWMDEGEVSPASVFAVAYRGGSIGSYSAMFTERQLGCCMEGLLYGYLATGTTTYLTAFEEVLDTAYRHATTTDQDELNAITMPYSTYIWPPQDAWIHNGNQHGDEGLASQPFNSVWMGDLTLDPLLQYEYLTGDVRIPDLFVHLTRFMRDTGSCYRRSGGNQSDDSFLHPATTAALVGNKYRLIEPPYVVGQNELSVREKYGSAYDRLHAPEAAALAMCGVWGLVKQDAYEDATVRGTFCDGYHGFASEGDTFLAMLHEFIAMVKYLFVGLPPDNADGYDYMSTYTPDLATGGWTSALLASGTNEVSETVTADHTTDTFTSVATALENANPVIISVSEGGALPTGLTVDRVYWVINKNTDTFQISTTVSGAASTFTSNGSGTLTATSGPYEFTRGHKIGYRSWDLFPNRKASWFFNATMFIYALAQEIHLDASTLQAPGIVDLSEVLHWTSPDPPYLD